MRAPSAKRICSARDLHRAADRGGDLDDLAGQAGIAADRPAHQHPLSGRGEVAGDPAAFGELHPVARRHGVAADRAGQLDAIAGGIGIVADRAGNGHIAPGGMHAAADFRLDRHRATAGIDMLQPGRADQDVRAGDKQIVGKPVLETVRLVGPRRIGQNQGGKRGKQQAGSHRHLRAPDPCILAQPAPLAAIDAL